MESEEEYVAISCLLIDEERRKRRKRRFWVHQINSKRFTFGEYHTLFPDLVEDDAKFFSYFRMTHEKFQTLLDLLEPYLSRQITNFRVPVGSKERLAVCLRFLATGMSYRSMAFSNRMGLTTIRNIVHSTCKALWKVLQPLVMPTPDEQMWKRFEKEFCDKWNFPNAVGALDGKHIVIEAPNHSGSDYFCYKKCFSIVLLALVDADKRFIFVDVGGYGKNSDGSIFGTSDLGKRLEDGTIGLPSAKKLPGSNVYLPYVIVADEAFPLRTNLMRPFPRDDIQGNEERKIFNYRLSRARNVVENSFGILVRRFRLFERKIALSQDHLMCVVLAICCLHNFLMRDTCFWTEDDMQETISNARSMVPPRGTGGLSGSDPLSVRDIFKDYFNSDLGSVQWQTKRVRAGKRCI